MAESGGKLIAAAPLENDAASLRDPDGHADDIRPLLEQQAAVIRARRRFVRAA